MEFFGFMAFILVMFSIGLPDKVKKLKARVRKLERKISTGGEPVMSDILKELEGKNCTMVIEGDFSHEIHCLVEKVDEDWIQVVESTKKGTQTRILKIENIKEVTGIQ